MHKGLFGIPILLAACLLMPPLSLGATTLELSTPDLRPPGSPFEGTLTIRFDRLVPDDAQIFAYIDGSSYPESVLDAGPFGGTYQYKQYAFAYSVIANGKNEWKEYPNKNFWFKLSATGTCGQEECAKTYTCECGNPTPLCTPPDYPPYTCTWTVTREDLAQANVNANEGLKRIADGEDFISPPASANQDTVWSEIVNNPTPPYSPYGIQTTMRVACGGMNYMGQTTEPNGWIKRSLPNEDFVAYGPTSKKIIIEPFDESSLTINRKKFIESDCIQPYVCGGIYRDGTRLTSGFSVNGTSGEIIISSFSPTASYSITYLPPNGPLLCAYTNSALPNSSSWTKKIPDSGIVSYNSPFSKGYTESQLPILFNSTNKFFVNPPACPAYAVECNQTATSYSAAKDSDPSGGYISVSYSGLARTVNASLSSPDLVKVYSKVLNLSDFEGLAAPSSLETHTLKLSLKSAGSEIASAEFQFTVCQDNDGDGFCPEMGDCNDTNPQISPGIKELCNGKDDDCDGQVDEDFMGVENKLGTVCGKGVCKGVYACSADGKTAVCSNASLGGNEICENTLDDDCDGMVDEVYEQVGGIAVKACDACKAGSKKPCGSNVGECRNGTAQCVNGDWSKVCYGNKGPSEETCNSKDDDCDGTKDDVYGGKSSQETGCGCYGGAQPAQEICDNIDNDCNGEADDGVQCCQQGDTRPCGLKRGACVQGVQACKNGYWESECKGGTRPNPEGEICYNGIDDNCNGEMDENCNPDFTCGNGKKDANEAGIDCGGICKEECGLEYGWVLFALGVILLIIVVASLELKGKM